MLQETNFESENCLNLEKKNLFVRDNFELRPYDLAAGVSA